MHDYQKIAAIVGEDKIEALREAGVDIADKLTKPTTGLLGRWAKDEDGSPALISSDYVRNDGNVWITYLTDRLDGGTDTTLCPLSSLKFPEDTTRPEDVAVGEAWLVNTDDGTYKAESVPAVKIGENDWSSGGMELMKWWGDDELTLITPLVPARPVDSDRESAPETVTTEEEYAALPEGSIVAEDHLFPYWKEEQGWGVKGGRLSNHGMSGTTRQVLRKGWRE